MAKMSKKPRKRKDSRLFAETRSVEKIIVLTSCPCAVPKPVRRTIPRHPWLGVGIGEGISAERQMKILKTSNYEKTYKIWKPGEFLFH